MPVTITVAVPSAFNRQDALVAEAEIVRAQVVQASLVWNPVVAGAASVPLVK